MALLRIAIFGINLSVFRVENEFVEVDTLAAVIAELSKRLALQVLPHDVPDIKDGQPEWFRLCNETGEAVGGLIGVYVERNGRRIRPMHQMDFPIYSQDVVTISSVA